MENERIRPTRHFYELLETIIAGEGNLKEADKAAGLKFGTFSRWTTQKEREVSAELLIVLARNLGEKYHFSREQVYVMAGLLEPPKAVPDRSAGQGDELAMLTGGTAPT